MRGTILALATFCLTAGGCASEPASPPQTEKTVERWMAKWCKVEQGTTRSDAEDLMGSSTSEVPNAELRWARGAHTFVADLDTGDVVSGTRASLDPGGNADPQRIGCKGDGPAQIVKPGSGSSEMASQ